MLSTYTTKFKIQSFTRPQSLMWEREIKSPWWQMDRYHWVTQSSRIRQRSFVNWMKMSFVDLRGRQQIASHWWSSWRKSSKGILVKHWEHVSHWPSNGVQVKCMPSSRLIFWLVMLRWQFCWTGRAIASRLKMELWLSDQAVSMQRRRPEECSTMTYFQRKKLQSVPWKSQEIFAFLRIITQLLKC